MPTLHGKQKKVMLTKLSHKIEKSKTNIELCLNNYLEWISNLKAKE